MHICCRLWEIYYYSFICRRWFENFVFVISARTDERCLSSSFCFFFCFFVAGLAVGKLIFLLSTWPSTLENVFFFCRLIAARWKNYLSFASLDRFKNHLSYAAQPGSARWKNHLSFICRPGPCRSLIYRQT